jgi:hypothetical protein
VSNARVTLIGHAAADAVFAAGPAGTDQPAVDTVLCDQIAQHAAVDGRTSGRNGEPKQVENSGRAAPAAFRARDLRSVSRQEVIHRLRRRSCDGGNTPNARRQHHHVLRLRRATVPKAFGIKSSG